MGSLERTTIVIQRPRKGAPDPTDELSDLASLDGGHAVQSAADERAGSCRCGMIESRSAVFSRPARTVKPNRPWELSGMLDVLAYGAHYGGLPKEKGARRIARVLIGHGCGLSGNRARNVLPNRIDGVPGVSR